MQYPPLQRNFYLSDTTVIITCNCVRINSDQLMQRDWRDNVGLWHSLYTMKGHHTGSFVLHTKKQQPALGSCWDIHVPQPAPTARLIQEHYNCWLREHKGRNHRVLKNSAVTFSTPSHNLVTVMRDNFIFGLVPQPSRVYSVVSREDSWFENRFRGEKRGYTASSMLVGGGGEKGKIRKSDTKEDEKKEEEEKKREVKNRRRAAFWFNKCR